MFNTLSRRKMWQLGDISVEDIITSGRMMLTSVIQLSIYMQHKTSVHFQNKLKNWNTGQASALF